MKRILIMVGTALCLPAFADTIDHYMNIANNIPQMELKADPQAQAWARSARTVLVLACDSVNDTLMLANDNAKAKGAPLFCLPAGTQISPESMNELIQQTYKETQQSDKDKLTVSQVALMGMIKKYPCAGQQQGYGQQQAFGQQQPYGQQQQAAQQPSNGQQQAPVQQQTPGQQAYAQPQPYPQPQPYTQPQPYAPTQAGTAAGALNAQTNQMAHVSSN